MMMQTAGGPGAVTPLDFADRRKPMPRWMALAIGASVIAHAGIGVALYHQRFRLDVLPPTPQGPVIQVETIRMPRPKPVETTAANPPAPNAPIHRTPAPTQPTETLDATPAQGAVDLSTTTLTLDRVVAEPAPGGTETRVVELVPRGPAVIANPRWVSKPTGEQLMRAYPARALERNATGAASLTCEVRVNGSLTGCSVLSETPSGQGFGRAALGLSRYFVMSPRTEDGQAVDGARVTVGVRFTLPED